MLSRESFESVIDSIHFPHNYFFGNWIPSVTARLGEDEPFVYDMSCLAMTNRSSASTTRSIAALNASLSTYHSSTPSTKHPPHT